MCPMVALVSQASKIAPVPKPTQIRNLTRHSTPDNHSTPTAPASLALSVVVLTHGCSLAAYGLVAPGISQTTKNSRNTCSRGSTDKRRHKTGQGRVTEARGTSLRNVGSYVYVVRMLVVRHLCLVR